MLVGLLVGALLVAGVARADEGEVSGAVTANVLVDEPGGGAPALGAGGLVDLWAPFGVFRIGGALGIGALASKDANVSRAFMPGGLSMAVVWRPKAFGFDLRVRGGAWGGAIGNGLAIGGWVAGGAYIEYAPDEHVALAAGTDVWFLFGHGDTYVVAPGIGLVWTLDPD